METVKHAPRVWFSENGYLYIDDVRWKISSVVTACNSREDLLEALISSTDEHKKTQTHLQKRTGYMSRPLQDIIDNNNSAIAKAEGK